MIRCLRGIPSLQRRFLYVAVSFGLLFLVYLIITGNEAVRKKSDKSRILDAIEKSRDEPQGKNPFSQTRRIPDTPEKEESSDLNNKEEVDVHEPSEHEKPKDIPQKTTQKTFPKDPYSGPQNEKQEEIQKAFLHAWNAYKKYAWGHDELRPISKSFQEWFGGIGLTIVDSVDTMFIMGLKDEFKKATEWVKTSLHFNKNAEAQLFEIVIRELGGLLSAYHLSGEQIYADKAVELGEKLMPCFRSTNSKIPCNRINLERGAPQFTDISTAEVGTIQLEFRDLSRVSKNQKYEETTHAISQHLHNLQKLDGLVACFLNPYTGTFRTSSTVSAGASADSYYEYLVKQWLQTGKTIDWFKTDFEESWAGIKKHLLKYTHPSKMAFVGALGSMHASASFRNEMEHLACFLPGTIALGVQFGIGNEEDLELAKNLTHTCYQMYKMSATGLGPEVAIMNIHPGHNQDIRINHGAQYNLQRPETVESIFYLYRVTKDEKYRLWGWEIFQAFEKYTKLKEGYASINSVSRPESPGYRDKMETFYLAETLKYLYLLFSDDPNLLPLDKWVFNTEAHPLPVYNR